MGPCAQVEISHMPSRLQNMCLKKKKKPLAWQANNDKAGHNPKHKNKTKTELLLDIFLPQQEPQLLQVCCHLVEKTSKLATLVLRGSWNGILSAESCQIGYCGSVQGIPRSLLSQSP